ncbi:MAG: zinc-ribbon domain-containing protein [Lachnospiraceae bacterium]|nr:zinc-ribbon domain-containing protein [Lachnospiraceae bacterium]
MFCENCGARLTADEVYCPECGMRQDAASPLTPANTVCPFCGKALEPDSVFCKYCGKKLTGQSLPSIPDQPSAESANVTSPEKTKPFPLALVIIPAIVLLIFLAVRYGGSIITPPKPDPDTQQVLGSESSNVVTQEPDSDVTSIAENPQETNTESALPAEPVTEPESEAEAESEAGAEAKAEAEAEVGAEAKAKAEAEAEAEAEAVNEATPKPQPEPDTGHESKPADKPALRYDPLDYETFKEATLADFTWVTYDIAHGILPSGLDRLENFEEVEGGWKMYIIDDPDGTYDSPMERLCRCAFGADANGRCIGIRWDYIHNYHTDEGWDDKTSDSFFYGPWDNGVFSGIGPGSITITDFWHANNHEYAVGRMTWPDGVPAVIFLVRP